MHRTVKPHPHHLRNTARIVAVRLVDLRLPGTSIFYRPWFYWWGRERGSGGDVRLSI
jgi:hypothetical protein